MLENQSDWMFTMFPIFFGIVFVFILIIFVTVAIKGLSSWNRNNHQPRLNTQAKVVAKRMSIRGGREIHTDANSHTHTHTSTHSDYFITFEFESGDRIELGVSGTEYGQIVEGDIGELQFQGTRYLGFIRNTSLKDNANK
ncbi:MAG: DUF2500 domain-containing protein [Bacillota bacterium]|nr:DUF2500 domain-containing protein [Bacillota bacterium]MDP4171528.1 DUF2500 domain-containing protein [Bacillota bacterium]